MARAALKAIPKKPGPYTARIPNSLYKPPPPRTAPSRRPPPPPSVGDKVKQIKSATRFGIYGVGISTFVIVAYSTMLYMSFSRNSDTQASQSPEQQSDVSRVYDQTAEGFDAEVQWSEIMMRITKARKRLAAQAEGDVLEVSSGTARNLGYYKFGKITSLTLIDLSQQMVDQGKKKWDILNPGKVTQGVPIRFLQGDCVADMPAPPARPQSETEKKDTTFKPGLKKGYDTIVQTMGLCSTPSPVDLLKNLARHLDTSNPDAKILLLEHGRSYYQWMNKILDSQANQHADRHGCWWNRDIGQIVEESGLEIVNERRKHFGTTWIFELKPKRVTEAMREKAEKVEEKAEQTVQSQPAEGWFSWLSR